MSDLISRSKLLEKVKAQLQDALHGAEVTGQTRFKQKATDCKNFIDLIEHEPTVEAVPVVRCKNCEHWGTGVAGETEHVKCCEYAKYMVGENGYCVYGELRTSAK